MQCGSDLNVHRWLAKVRSEFNIQNAELKGPTATKSFNIVMIMQIIPYILFLICTIFGIFVGMQFLSFVQRAELQNNFISTKPEFGFEQLQQMNSIITKELDLIIDQRKENQALQTKLEELTKHTAIPVTTSSSGEETL